MTFRFPSLPLTAALLVLAPATSLAAWPHNPAINVPVCTAAGVNQNLRAISDGSGGMIVVWQDSRDAGPASRNIYAQHVLASGTADPLWPANGRAICLAAGDQTAPVLAPDGSGGAIVAWTDERLGAANADIYAQHVTAAGTVDPSWPADGRLICGAASNQSNPSILENGSGGAFIAWDDFRAAQFDIYAHRVLASGAVDPAWAANGLAVCTATGAQSGTALVSDLVGGMIVAWQDERGGAADIYAQRVRASGSVDPAWPANGRGVCTASGAQTFVVATGDGAGGAILAWRDLRPGTSDIYAHRIRLTGTVDPNWGTDGRALCVTAGNQDFPVIVSDGEGGAIVAWQDSRVGAPDIYALRVTASGSTDGAWPTDGLGICSAPGAQTLPAIVTDGAGGALFAWTDARNGLDVYTHHVSITGSLDSFWPLDGRATGAAGGSQANAAMVADGQRGAIVAWEDDRSGESDAYAQRVAPFGVLGTPEPVITGVLDIPNDQGGQVKLSWNASWLDFEAIPVVVENYRIYRSVAPNAAASTSSRTFPGEYWPDATRSRTSSAGDTPGEREMLAQLEAITGYAWEFLVVIPAENLPFISAYSYVAPTLGDSSASSNAPTAFLIAAMNEDGTQYWASLPATGYSVDDLPPATPTSFVGEPVSGTTHLEWDANTEPDLANYRLYRGFTPDFVPSAATRIATPSLPVYDDALTPGAFYKLSAVDLHDNESGFALVGPGSTTATPDGPARALSLATPRPNPARGVAELAYSLPRESRVSLVVFDVAGRQVRSLIEGAAAAGDHVTRWDLTDDGGARVAAGFYLVRLEADGRRIVRRLAVSP